MSNRISRREFGKLAGFSVAASVVPAAAQSTQAPEAEIKELESKLAEPFSAQAKKLASENLASIERSAKRRWAFKLPENSEPCTIYVPEITK